MLATKKEGGQFAGGYSLDITLPSSMRYLLGLDRVKIIRACAEV